MKPHVDRSVYPDEAPPTEFFTIHQQADSDSLPNVGTRRVETRSNAARMWGATGQKSNSHLFWPSAKLGSGCKLRCLVVSVSSNLHLDHSMSTDNPMTIDSKPCPYCGETVKAIARKCRHCREYLDEELKAENRASTTASTADRFLMPVDRPVSAIAAGYLGLFSLLPLFGILAVAVGFHALSVLKKNPELTGRGRAIFGIVMGVVFTLIYGAMIVAAAVSKQN